MSTKGSIIDSKITIKPSEKLCQYICESFKNELELPENILNIYREYTKKQDDNKKSVKIEPNEIVNNFTIKELNYLKELNGEQTDDDDIGIVNTKTTNTDGDQSDKKNHSINDNKNKNQSKLLLNVNDIKWINEKLIKQRSVDSTGNVSYLVDLLMRDDCEILLPKNEIIERNPVLEARCERLRLEQDAYQYNAMTKNVDNVRRKLPEDTIAYQMKQINRHLIAVLQFLFSVAAGFAFGFIGIPLIIGDFNFGARILLGIAIALVIAIAEIYFLIKQLNEEYNLSVEKPKLITGSKEINNTKDNDGLKLSDAGSSSSSGSSPSSSSSKSILNNNNKIVTDKKKD